MDIQLYPPVLTHLANGQLDLAGSSSDDADETSIDANANTCLKDKTVMQYDFASSYGTPFVGKSHRSRWERHYPLTLALYIRKLRAT